MLDHRVEMIAEEWIKHFNNQDIERLLSLYHDQGVHYSPRFEEEQPQTKGWLRGKEELREWWQRNFDELPNLEYDLREIVFNETKAYMEYTRKTPGERNKCVVESLKIDELGFIVESRVLRSWTN